MGLFDHISKWTARMGGNEEKARQAERRILVEKGEALETAGKLEEAASAFADAGETLRAAHLAQRAGDWEQAARLFTEAKRFAEAARVLEQAKEWPRAGELFEKAADPAGAERCFKQAPKAALLAFQVRREKWAEAAKTAEEMGDGEAAANHFEKAGDLEASERCWRAARKLLSAAEMFQRLGRFSRAGKVYEEAGLPTRAAEMHERGGNHADAARILGPMAISALAGARTAPHKLQQEAQALAGRAAGHALAAGDAPGAATLFERAGDPARAAECLLGTDPKRAAQLFEKAGEIARAASAWEKAGDGAAAQLLRAQASDPARAAEILGSQGRHAEAGDLLQKLGKRPEAAEAYKKAGRFAQAGELLQGEKDLAGAAECFERAGLFARAEPLYRAARNDEGHARLLLRRGDFKEIARIRIRRNEFDAAIHALQQLPQETEVCALLAHCFRARGMDDQALLKYEEAVRGQSMVRESVGIYYEYARLLEDRGQAARASEIYTSILAVDLDYGDVRRRLEQMKAEAPTRSLPALPDRYEIQSELDRGGEGTVYLAHDRVLGRKVALKFIPAGAGNRPMTAEAKNIAALNHPNIVTLHEIHEHEKGVVLVLEFLDGVTLKKRVEAEGPLPAAEVARVGRGICAALQYAHERKLVHRDVKPANVMLVGGGGVKVLDFGMARPIEDSDVSSTLCGTPMFMAPEQILCRRPDARTDVYGLGATLYFALTGHPPFKGQDVFYQHLHCLPAPARSIVPAAPAALDELILRCLAKQPEERPSSAAEVEKALSL